MTIPSMSRVSRFMVPALLLGVCLVPPGVLEAQIRSTASGDIQGGGVPGPGPDNLYDQSGACDTGGPASQEFPDFGDSRLQAADDFTVPDGATWTLNRVYNQGIFFNANPNSGPFDSVIVEVYDDSGPGGLPGSLICQETGLASAGGGSDPSIDVDLDGSCSLGPGNYWLSIMADMPFAPAGQYAWSVNDSTNGSEFAWQDPDGLTGNPCASWGLGITTCGIGAAFSDLCFGIDGDDGAGVPTMPPFGLLAVLAVLVLLSLLMARRHSRA